MRVYAYIRKKEFIPHRKRQSETIQDGVPLLLMQFHR